VNKRAAAVDKQSTPLYNYSDQIAVGISAARCALHGAVLGRMTTVDRGCTTSQDPCLSVASFFAQPENRITKSVRTIDNLNRTASDTHSSA
jgi:hypothetical protein